MHLLELVKTNLGVLIGKPDYWHPRIRANSEIENGFNENYYLDLSAKADYRGELDVRGIPLLRINKKPQYVPAAISHFGLGCYQRYLTSNQQEYLDKFLRCISWFEDNCQSVGSACVWLSHYEKELYSLKPPWTSALVQGQIMSILCRGYAVTRNSSYLNLALKAARAFEIPASEGGVRTWIDGRDYVFYEEFPSSKPSYVLNGFIFSLWGLYDLYSVSKDRSILSLYQDGLKTLFWILPRYDLFSWPRYDLHDFRVPNISNIFYANLHVEQLRVMFAITGNERFKKYAERWAKAKKEPLVLILSQALMLLHKTYVKFGKMIWPVQHSRDRCVEP